MSSYFAAGLEEREFCVWATSEPVTVDEAQAVLASRIPGYSQHLARGSIEILSGPDFYLEDDRVDPKRISSVWDEKLQRALDRGYEGIRISSNAFWLGTRYSEGFRSYERELREKARGRRMIIARTYGLENSGATELLDVVRACRGTAVVRNGEWEYVEAAAIEFDALPLTPRQNEVLEWVARGKSAWEIGEILGISKRTVDRHIEDATGKLGASNRTEAVAIAIRDRMLKGEQFE